MTDFINIAAKNIRLIKSTPNELLHRNQLIYDDKKGVFLEEIIHFLVSHEYIETDDYSGNYFLTTKTYDLFEMEEITLYTIEDDISRYFPSTIDLIPQEATEEIEQQLEEIIEKDETDTSKNRYLYIIILICVWGFIGTILNDQQKEEGNSWPPTPNFSQEYIDQLTSRAEKNHPVFEKKKQLNTDSVFFRTDYD